MHIHTVSKKAPAPAQDLAQFSLVTTLLQIISAIVGGIGLVNSIVVHVRAKNAGT